MDATKSQSLLSSVSNEKKMSSGLRMGSPLVQGSVSHCLHLPPTIAAVEIGIASAVLMIPTMACLAPISFASQPSKSRSP